MQNTNSEDSASTAPLTLIVPFHNAEELIPGLIGDLQSQIYPDFITIFVDDHSTDSTHTTIERLSNGLRYKIIDSRGNGPGAARNEGLRHARSPYVTFVDADDRLDDEFVQAFVRSSSGGDSEIVECMFKALRENGAVVSRTNVSAFISKTPRFESVLTGSLSRVSWAKAYSLTFLREHNIRFPEHVHNGEDHIFVLRCFSMEPRVKVLISYLYTWMRRQQSLTTRAPDERMVDDFIFVLESKVKLMKGWRGGCLHDQFAIQSFREVRTLRQSIQDNSDASRVLLERLTCRLSRSIVLRSAVAYVEQSHPKLHSEVFSGS